MEIYIDGKPLDTDQSTNAPLTIALSSVTDVATGKIPFSKTIEVPDTPANRRVLAYASEVHNLERFNNARHPARIEQDGFVVMQGVAQLSKVETTPTGRYFHLNLIGDEIGWITAASQTALSDTELGLAGTISDALVRESLSDYFSMPYKLFPIQKGSFVEEAGEDKWRERRQTILSDYAPFFHLPTLFRAIFRQAGYNVSSAFLESGAVSNLYVSGRWKPFDTDELDEKYGFRAGRFAGKEITTVNGNGIEASYVGNIVETADPDAEDADGEKADNVYNNGGGFRMIGEKPVYVVPENMTVGLLYSLHYFSPITVGYGSSGFTDIRWFDRVEIAAPEGGVLSFDMSQYAPDFHTDVRRAITGGTRYYAVISSFLLVNPGEKVVKWLIGISADGEKILEEDMIEWQAFRPFTTSDTTYGRAYLFKKTEGVAELERIEDGYWKIFEVPQEVEVDAKIYLPATKQGEGTHIQIAAPAFRGYSASGLSIADNTTVETYFSPQVAAGDAVSSANMLAFDEVKQLDFIKGVKQLFNLHLYTDPAGKMVYIEPRDDFYSGPVLDWTDKVDWSKNIEMEELGGDLGGNFVLAYKEGDPQVEALDAKTGTKYAQYAVPILNTVNKQDDYIVSNEFFTPAIIRAGGYAAARSVALLQIGDPEETEDETPYQRDMSFEPKIVKYEGRVMLTGGERWYYPDGEDTKVPVVAFQDEKVNLGFDGEDGLNRYYRENIELYNRGRRLTLHLYLTPRDVESFTVLTDDKRDFRATILLRMYGETVLCKQEEIKDFDPRGRGSTKCVLITG